MLTVETLLQAPNLRDLLDEAELKWQEEQRRRHQFWADVDESVKVEFILGEAVHHMPAEGQHWLTSSNIISYLLPHVYHNQLGKVGYEKVMIRLTRNDYEPDICFWNSDIASSFGLKQSAFPPPDFIVEILSDSTRDRDYGIKLTDYALHGVREYWIVDTEQQTIEQFLPDGGELKLGQKLKDGALTSEAIPGFSISVKAVFAFDA